MTHNRYELRSEKYPEEHIYIEYIEGYLSAIVLPVKHRLDAKAYNALMAKLPYLEEEISVLGTIRLTVIKELPANLKIALFCKKYMEHHAGMKYKANGAEGKQVKNFNITPEILDHYFTSTNFLFSGKHSVFNLTRYWNELMAEINQKGRPSHPNHYSKEYAEKLSAEQLPSYWKHLRDLGLQPTYNTIGAMTGSLTGWVKRGK